MRLENRIPPPIVALIAAAGMWGVDGLFWVFDVPVTLQKILIGGLLVAGLMFDVLGIFSFRTSRTTINPLKPESSSALVTDGIYGITRNPMYVGMVLFLLAWAVYLASLLPFLGPLAFMGYITHFQIKPEERALGEIFGNRYRIYTERVGRWL